jgi:tetratricopeptide (TPR) repeat protein
LSVSEQGVLERLSQFRGGFNLEAAEAVAGATIRQLMTLVHKSLLRRETGRDRGGRFQVHELLRQYASEKLGEQHETERQVRNLHGKNYFDMLKRQGEAMQGKQFKVAHDIVAADLDNIHAAWNWFVEENVYLEINETLLALFIFYSTRGFSDELNALIQKALSGVNEASGEDEAIYMVRLLILHAWTSSHEFHRSGYQSILNRAFRMIQDKGIEESVGFFYSLLGLGLNWEVPNPELLYILEDSVSSEQTRGNQWTEIMARTFLAGVHSSLLRRNKAERLLLEAEELATKQGNPLLIAQCLSFRAWNAAVQQAYEKSKVLIQRCREIYLSIGDTSNAIQALFDMGSFSNMAGLYPESAQYFQECYELYTKLGNLWEMSAALSWKSIAEVRAGNYDTAILDRQRMLALSQELNDDFSLAWGLWELGDLMRLMGKSPAAREHYERSFKMFQQVKHEYGYSFYYRGLGQLAINEGAYELAEDYLQKCIEYGLKEIHEWPASVAMSHQGWIKMIQRKFEEGFAYLQDALSSAAKTGDRCLYVFPMLGLLEYLVANNRLPEAVQINAFIQAYHGSWRETKDQAAALMGRYKDKITSEELGLAELEGQKLTATEVLNRWLVNEQ